MRCELRISWADESKSHRVIHRILKDLNVSATITVGTSVCPDDDQPDKDVRRIEQSAIIDMYSVDKRKIIDEIWPSLRDALDLTCAYVHEDGIGFNGCILDYDVPSRCPKKKSDEQTSTATTQSIM